jgi:hypothetical protein
MAQFLKRSCAITPGREFKWLPDESMKENILKQLRKRLTYANVMSSIAVFLVLGGATAIAAVELGANSVGTKQLKPNAVTKAKIKKNAVTTAKIKKDAVTGAKVKESTLGTVPSANLANSIPPAEPTHLVGAPGEPGFENGGQNLGSLAGFGTNPVGFYKDHEGIVHLQGWALAGPGTSGLSSLFTLPPGYRPAAGVVMILSPLSGVATFIGGTGASLSGIDLNGKVAGEEEELVVLDGITFRAES